MRRNCAGCLGESFLNIQAQVAVERYFAEVSRPIGRKVAPRL